MRPLSERGQAWAKIVAEQATGGLNIKTFCRERGVSEAGFYYWRRELQLRAAQPAAIPGGPANSSSTGFVAVVPAGAATQMAPASMAVVRATRQTRAVSARLVEPTGGGSGVVVQVDARLQLRLSPGFDRATLVAALAAVSEAGACWR